MIITELVSNSKLIELVQLLHSSLDIKIILTNFNGTLSEHLSFDSMHYKCEDTGYEYKVGLRQTNCYDYHLNVDTLPLGSLSITKQAPFEKHDILLFEEFLCLLVSPLKNAIMHQRALIAALHDPMTQLLNRSSFESTLEREIKLSKRHHRQLSIMEIDLDDFKSINDTYGHATGDNVIIHFTQQLVRIIRDSDIAFRLGGEEFLVILCHTTLEGANTLAERLRMAIETTPVNTDGPVIHYTISIGLAALNARFDGETLLNNADQALYQAKTRGKNQVQAYALPKH